MDLEECDARLTPRSAVTLEPSTEVAMSLPRGPCGKYENLDEFRVMDPLPSEGCGLLTEWNGIPHYLLDGTNYHERFGMLGDCTDFGCAVSDSGGTAKDSADGSAESPQLKRRRMLHCNHDDPVEIICAGPSSEFLNPKTGEEATTGEDKTREEEQWDTQLLGSSACRLLPVKLTYAPSIKFRGRPSYTKFPTTTASTVAYPFTLIKPCGDRGEVTLEEINQILRAPSPPSQDGDEDPD